MVGFVKSPEQPLQTLQRTGRPAVEMELMAAAPLQGSGRCDWPQRLNPIPPSFLGPFWGAADLDPLGAVITLNIK
jgi:hypothetical protein